MQLEKAAEPTFFVITSMSYYIQIFCTVASSAASNTFVTIDLALSDIINTWFSSGICPQFIPSPSVHIYSWVFIFLEKVLRTATRYANTDGPHTPPVPPSTTCASTAIVIASDRTFSGGTFIHPSAGCEYEFFFIQTLFLQLSMKCITYMLNLFRLTHSHFCKKNE